jgi:hypothetical protein
VWPWINNDTPDGNILCVINSCLDDMDTMMIGHARMSVIKILI